MKELKISYNKTNTHLSLKKYAIFLVILASYINCNQAKLKDKTASNVATIQILKTSGTSDTSSHTGCAQKGQPAKEGYFWILNMEENVYHCTENKKYKSGLYYDIWLEKGISDNKNIQDFAKKIEVQETYVLLFMNFGKPADVDANNKTDIVISNKIDNSVQGSNSYVSGYVSPSDYFKNDGNNYSNEKDILYLNYKLTNSSIDKLMATAIHELQHLIRVSHQVKNKEYKPDSYWINEGTSEYAADIAGYGPQKGRINCFNNNNFCRTGGVNGISLFAKPNIVYKNRSSLNNYSFFYTFLSFLYHNSGTDQTTRARFVSQVTTGVDPAAKIEGKLVRASNIKNLITAFKKYASNYDKTLLSEDETLIFGRLYTTFLLQASRTNTTNIEVRRSGKDKVFQTGDEKAKIQALLKKYKIQDLLKELHFKYFKPIGNEKINIALRKDLIAGSNLYFLIPNTTTMTYQPYPYNIVVSKIQIPGITSENAVLKVNYSFDYKVNEETMMPILVDSAVDSTKFFPRITRQEEKNKHLCIQNLLSIQQLSHK